MTFFSVRKWAVKSLSTTVCMKHHADVFGRMVKWKPSRYHKIRSGLLANTDYDCKVRHAFSEQHGNWSTTDCKVNVKQSQRPNEQAVSARVRRKEQLQHCIIQHTKSQVLTSHTAHRTPTLLSLSSFYCCKFAKYNTNYKSVLRVLSEIICKSFLLFQHGTFFSTTQISQAQNVNITEFELPNTKVANVRSPTGAEMTTHTTRILLHSHHCIPNQTSMPKASLLLSQNHSDFFFCRCKLEFEWIGRTLTNDALSKICLVSEYAALPLRLWTEKFEYEWQTELLMKQLSLASDLQHMQLHNISIVSLCWQDSWKNKQKMSMVTFPHFLLMLLSE